MGQIGERTPTLFTQNYEVVGVIGGLGISLDGYKRYELLPEGWKEMM